MNNENETAAALERARCEVRFFREVLSKIATPGPRVRRLKLAQAALGFWASLCDRGAGDFEVRHNEVAERRGEPAAERNGK